MTPSAQAFQEAAAHADWSQAPGFYLLLTDQAGAGSWPITGASFILMRANSNDAHITAALKFFDWAYTRGQALASRLDYVPIPASVVKLVEASWAKSLQVNGRPAWPAG